MDNTDSGIEELGSHTTANMTCDGSNIPVRTIGSFLVPAIITGMWQVAGGHGKIDPKKAVEEMKLYAFAGLGVFDLADIYGPSEEIYGHFLKEYWGPKPVRGFTKFVPRYGNSGSNTRAVVEASIDRSRQRMGVNTLDMVQFHWWDYGDARYCDAMKWLYTLQQEGKIKELGLTNFDTEHMAKIVGECAIPIVSNQVAYSIIDTRPEKLMVPWCLKNNVKILAYGHKVTGALGLVPWTDAACTENGGHTINCVPWHGFNLDRFIRTLLGGFLSQKYLGQPEPKKIDLTTSSLSKYKYVIDQWGGWALFQELLLALSQIAEKYKISISNVAIRYIADKPAIGAVIVGARLSITEHIASTQATYAFPGLDEGDMALIHSVVKKGSELPGDCGDEYR